MISTNDDSDDIKIDLAEILDIVRQPSSNCIRSHFFTRLWQSYVYPKTFLSYCKGTIEARAKLDMKAFTEKGNIFGYEVKATNTLIHYDTGLIEVRLGAGITSAAKIEDGTIDARFLGCGKTS